MVMSITQLQMPLGDKSMYDVAFRNIIESHLKYLREHINTRVIYLDPQAEYLYTGDFYGLLQSMGYPHDIQWIIMRINWLHSTIDYTGELKAILIPPEAVITNLLTRFLNVATIS